jgi:plastocyanin
MAGLVLGGIVAVSAAVDVGTALAQKARGSEVTILMGDYDFRPSAVTVRANEPIRFVLPNVGADRHRVNFALPGSDDRVRSDATGGGGTVILDTTFTVPGVYEMWCSVSTDGVSHRDLGMVGTLTVVR